MHESKIVDIHTHSPSHDESIVEVLVANTQTLAIAPPLVSAPLCVGLHPWFIKDIEFSSFKSMLKHYLSHPNFFALGEIGLDKACDINFDQQMNVFCQQLELAHTYRVPRIVIHSVKAHSEVLSQLKSHKYKGKILIHDFYGSIETAEQYLKYDSYFSFGKKIFNNKNAQHALRNLPNSRVFLETDDQTTHNIFDIYEQASILLDLSLEELKDKIYINYNQFSS